MTTQTIGERRGIRIEKVDEECGGQVRAVIAQQLPGCSTVQIHLNAGDAKWLVKVLLNRWLIPAEQFEPEDV